MKRHDKSLWIYSPPIREAHRINPLVMGRKSSGMRGTGSEIQRNGKKVLRYEREVESP